MKKITVEDWRMLGFYFSRQDTTQTWTFAGSKHSLGKFCSDIENFADSTKRHNTVEDHQHWGPYENLKVEVSHHTEIAQDGLHGTADDLLFLATLVRHKLEETKIGEEFTISKEFPGESHYTLRFVVKDYGFDPAMEDEQLWR